MFKVILVCLDGSKLAEQVIPYVIDTGKAFSSKIIILQVLREPDYGILDKTKIPLKPSRAVKDFETLKADTRAYLKQASEPIRQAKLEVEYVIRTGEVGKAIVDYAEKNRVDLVAIATHGSGGLVRAVLGSVADHVIRNLRIPILVIRPVNK